MRLRQLSNCRRLVLQRLERRNMLTATVLDFEELDPADAYNSSTAGTVNYFEYAHEGYELNSTASEFAASLNGRWRMSLPNDHRYTGSNALSSVWAPVTISLSRTDGATFSIDTIDLYPWLPVYNPSVSFTAELSDGGSVNQVFNLQGSTIQTYQFDGQFNDIVELTWQYTGFADYHTFDNIVLDDSAAQPIQIDIDDIIDLKRDRTIKVTLLSDPDFDPGSVSVDSLELTINNIAFDVARNGGGKPNLRSKDLNGDGVKDLIVGFEFDSLQLQVGSYFGTLSGEFGENAIVGTDSGEIVAKRSGKPT